MLQITNLTVMVDDKKILSNFNLTIPDGQIHVLMGHNGSGKSTLCKAIMHDSEYKITEGKIIYQDQDITNLTPTEIARAKVFYVNQNPMPIEGVTNAEMLRMALAEINQTQVGIFTLNQKLQEACDKLKLPHNFIHREINVGMSGGERKKNELLQMWILNPSLILLDEIDSGLDVDAINVVADNIKEYYELNHPTILIITHQKKLIDLLKPEQVHILDKGKIIASGDYSLAKKIENEGFAKTFDISGLGSNE